MPDPSAVTPKAPWYAQGLSFECLPDCGACCTNHGDYSYVYLAPQDAQQIATFLGLELAAFESAHVASDEGAPTLAMHGPSCPFLEGTRCAIYPARPTQCRTFPFWKENLRSPAHWERLRTFCPGIDRGPRHPLALIGQHLAES